MFGSTSTFGSGSTFGGTSGGLFGSKPASTFGSGSSLFGSGTTSGGGLFGSTPTTGSGLFGSTTTAGFSSGSTQLGTKHAAWTGTNQQEKNKKHGMKTLQIQSISGMDQYKTKSHEELRLEDLFNTAFSKPGTATTSSFGGGMFGSGTSTSTGGGLFGSTASTGSSIFGSSGTSGGGLFGQSKPSTGFSGFGSSSSGGLFGSKPATSGGLFGSGTTTSTGSGLFGSSTTGTGGGLFGSSTNTGGGLFGSNTSTGGGLFGSSNTSTTGSGLFGSSTLGSTTNTGGGLFGSNNTSSGSLFGNSNTNTGGSLFGGNTGGSLFGTNNKSGGLFGSNNTFGSSTSTGLFGNNNTSSNLFGSSNTNNTNNMTLIAQPNANPYAINLELAKEQVTEYTACPTKKVTIARKTQSVDAPSFGFVPRRYQPNQYNMKTILMNEYKGSFKRSPELASSVLWNDRNTAFSRRAKPSHDWRRQWQKLSSKRTLQPLPLPEPPKLKTCNLDDENPPDFVPFEEEEKMHLLPPRAVSSRDQTLGAIEERRLSPGQGVGHKSPIPITGNVTEKHMRQDANPSAFKGDPAPKLANPEVRTEPPFKDLCAMPERQLASVADFEMEQVEFGRIKWDEPVDLRGVNLDDIVRFSQSTFEIYPDIDPPPALGTGFMRPCSVMLYNVWPKGCSSMKRPSFEREERFRASLEKYCNTLNYKYITYDTSGVLEFSANHENSNPSVGYEEF